MSAARLTIDLTALVDNWRTLDAMSGSAECAAVIKGNGYGIALPVALKTLVEAGCKNFFVATLAEGVEARANNKDVTVFILGDLYDEASAKLYQEHHLTPVLNCYEDVDAFMKCTHYTGKAALHVDTGMNRLGISEKEAVALSGNKEFLERLSLIMSHLACADTPSSLMNGCQLSSFRKVSERYNGVPASFCNSAGISGGTSFHMDMVRPGVALYGGTSVTDAPPLKCVVKVEAPILQIRNAEAHESVGYGASQTLSKPRRLATIGAGYADGYHRAAGSSDKSSGASAFLHGVHVPLVGRVSMDLMVVDVSEVPDAKRGDYVELFGPNMPISNVAEHAGTIDYELLTGIAHRYERNFASLT